MLRHALGIALPAVEIVVGHEPQLRQPVGQVFGQLFAHAAHGPRADDGLGPAVVDDVGRLGGGEVGVDHRVVQPAAAGRPHRRVHVLVVLHQDGHGVALDQAGLTEVVGQLVGALLELAVGHHDRRLRVQDHGGLVRGGLGVFTNLHGSTLRRR